MADPIFESVKTIKKCSKCLKVQLAECLRNITKRSYIRRFAVYENNVMEITLKFDTRCNYFLRSVRTTTQLLIPLKLCAFIFIREWRNLQFNVGSERPNFLEKLFHGRFIFTLRVFARNLLRGNRRRNSFFFSYFVLMSKLEYESGIYVQ